MKRFIIAFTCILMISLCTFNVKKISNFIAEKIVGKPKLVFEKANEYAKKESFMYVKLTDDYTPYSYNDLLNIIYTSINNGWQKFTFYCPSEYTRCIKDMEEISNNDVLLTHINNFVHPFNSFTNIKTTIIETGEINLNINYLYTQEEIKAINDKIDQIIKQNVKQDNSDYENIKALHDYIINNTKYDVQRNENGESNSKSFTAYGTLFDHLATCNGYTDTMAIILSKLGFTNYKIATTPDSISYESTGHIWNAVYIDNEWKHIDLTWDDPVSDDGKDYLYHKYFLVNNEELKKADDGDVVIEEHTFKKNIYLEFNDSIKQIISS